MLRSLKAFARQPLILPPQPIVVPMATFRTYAPVEGPQDPEKAQNDKTSSKNEATRAGAPSTDEIAHSDAAYSGSSANPNEAAQKIEHEKTGPGSMQQSAANSNASKPPEETSP